MSQNKPQEAQLFEVAAWPLKIGYTETTWSSSALAAPEDRYSSSF
jgi:hypothetical protein